MEIKKRERERERERERDAEFLSVQFEKVQFAELSFIPQEAVVHI